MMGPPLTLDPETLRERLLTREGGVSAARGSLSKCAQRYRGFVEQVLSAAESPSSVTDELADGIEEAKQSLQWELSLHVLEMRKLVLVAEAAEAELARYDDAQLQIEADMEDCRGEIEALKTQLTHEKRVRRHREEYETLAAVANRRPARRRTERNLAQVTADIEKVRKEEARAVKELEVREKQFQLLMQSIFDLKANLSEDIKRRELESPQCLDEGDDERMDETEGKNMHITEAEGILL